MADYATLHTVYCAGVNEALKGSGYSIKCTRKGYNKVLNEDGVIIATLANIEFARYGGIIGSCEAKPNTKDISISMNHPKLRESGTGLELSEIKGYQLRTVDADGLLSDWVEFDK